MEPRFRIAIGLAAVLVSVYALVGTALTERIPPLGVVVMILLSGGVVLVTTTAGRAVQRYVVSS